MADFQCLEKNTSEMQNYECWNSVTFTVQCLKAIIGAPVIYYFSWLKISIVYWKPTTLANLPIECLKFGSKNIARNEGVLADIRM